VRVQAGTRPAKPKTVWIRSSAPVAPASPAAMGSEKEPQDGRAKRRHQAERKEAAMYVPELSIKAWQDELLYAAPKRQAGEPLV